LKCPDSSAEQLLAGEASGASRRRIELIDGLWASVNQVAAGGLK
jgi:hypothetical protein